MGPVLADIKRVFDEYKYFTKTYIGSRWEELHTCVKAPFGNEENCWMYDYLFPEILLDGDLAVPCFYFTEEQVLRIMAEHGLL